MPLIVHVVIALSNICFATYLYFSPSRLKLHESYVLVALTLISGFYMVGSTQTRILQSCIIGLLYLAGVSVVIASARHKLAEAEKKTELM